MDLFRKPLHIDFVSKRVPAYAFSITAIVLSLVSLAVQGLNFGIDFTGGKLVDLAFPQAVETTYVTQRLDSAGITYATVQHFGTDRDVLVRIPPTAAVDKTNLQDQVLDAFRKAGGPAPEIRRVEIVGAQVGQELVDKGGVAVIIALGGIALYIWLRFERRFAIGALAATLHDPILTLGWFSLTGTEFDLTVLAAILAVVGYSVNDTIVIFDRIRENFRKMRRAAPPDVINASINQTMSRSVITSGTTLAVVIAMLFFGGPLLYGFSVALVIGIVVGTYSSIYVASAVALDLGATRTDFATIDKQTGKPVEEDAR
ncbi:MAG: protein translocase subunit SecF [Thiohalocapsa sp.]|uniref:protein translocase subunit SecF n=1 Tax=Thiohalocapsa sp. TaxID=2497641 RepID=UPI0025F11D94|nr:protein translocase subunit SecF [Thiohalocapsa sp.]MCG6941629.1 protein translocase subunit SecF [Thiohalocapsa sp.]